MPVWFVRSTRKLATILGVDEGAVRYQERRGAIRREEDGAWSVWDVVADWRDHASWYPGRASVWLDPSWRITGRLECELNRRALEAGAERGEDDDGGHDDGT
jgi:hypothetical protein